MISRITNTALNTKSDQWWIKPEEAMSSYRPSDTRSFKGIPHDVVRTITVGYHAGKKIKCWIMLEVRFDAT